VTRALERDLRRAGAELADRDAGLRAACLRAGGFRAAGARLAVVDAMSQP
jgi:hypothetical protein